MYFTEIELTNFQAHKKSIIKLSRGVNIFKGTTHHGKSSIVRGLRWLLKNRPQGDGFVSWFADVKDITNVVVNTASHRVERYKTATENGYYLTPMNKAVENYKALRTDVPEQVLDALNITDINLQQQRDSYFLLDLSAGEVARTLNDTVGLSVLDEATKKLNSIVDKAKTGLTDAERKEAQLTEKIGALRWLRKAAKEFDEVKVLDDAVDGSQQKLEQLVELNSQYRKYTDKVIEIERLVHAGKYLDEVKVLLNRRQQYETQKKELSQLAESIQSTTDKIEVLQKKIVTNLKSRDIILSELKVCPVCNKTM